jgi:hypothetical protein
MSDAAMKLFNSIMHYKDVEELISNGESENLYIECKSPSGPKLNQDLQSTLAKAISGFSNTAGGIILWGVSTTKHAHSNLDILTQIEPIATCKLFEQQINKAIPSLTTPSITKTASRLLFKKGKDTRGVVVTYIPKSAGDPVQSNKDSMFYFRSGDEFTLAPYEMVKRLFAATDNPDLQLVILHRLTKRDENGKWTIPIAVENRSVAIAEHGKISILFKNPGSCEEITVTNISDLSELNAKEKFFLGDMKDIIHRGITSIIGNIYIKMKGAKIPKRLLEFEVSLYANRMRARKFIVSIHLAKTGFTVKEIKEDYLY